MPLMTTVFAPLRGSRHHLLYLLLVSRLSLSLVLRLRSNQSGDTPIREHLIPKPPNIVESSSIYLMPTISAEIQMSLMMSAFAPRCGSRHQPLIRTPSFEVEPIVGVEINKPSMLRLCASRLGNDIN
ncbi:hypothetical protein J1N35_038429 [Gossypium stocksii]|uniref:Secreted protein n=1 Tax=Gossypium stocksii TaxID=47602 RepID=A0A9D3ZMV7_9ROSI|nr:hypothetical protein J1N35_038429 [Gossypium stocksii]